MLSIIITTKKLKLLETKKIMVIYTLCVYELIVSYNNKWIRNAFRINYKILYYFSGFTK